MGQGVYARAGKVTREEIEAPEKKQLLAIGFFEATALVLGFLGAALLPGQRPVLTHIDSATDSVHAHILNRNNMVALPHTTAQELACCLIGPMLLLQSALCHTVQQWHKVSQST